MAERQEYVGDGATLVAELNDLLQLDHDAIRAYALAAERLSEQGLRSVVRRFREDHERHADELTRLIRSQGGTPTELPRAPTGPFELAVQAVGAFGGDRALLLAFKVNERRGRDQYRAATGRAYAPEAAAVVRRAAATEASHYAWALEALDDLGATRDGVVGRLGRAIEVGNARVAELVEGAERRAAAAAGRAREGVGHQVDDHPMRAALVAVGVGVVVGALAGRPERR